MRVVVAGGEGYIGSRLCRRLLGMGISVLPLSRRTAGSGAAPAVDLASASETLVSTLTDFRPDAVVNCAGTTSTDLRECVQAHVVVTANLLAAVARASPGSRLIQLGSAAEYGQAVEAPLLIREDTPPMPRGAYAVSKLASTLLAVCHGPGLGLECIALRIFNLIGDDMAPGTIIPNLMRMLRDPALRPGDPVELGRLDVYRDFVHVDDVVAAIVRAIEVPSIESGAIINVASGEAVMVRELVRRILDAAGHGGEIRELAPGTGRSVGVTWQRADVSRARQLLAWTPRKSLAEAVTELVRSGVRAA